MERKVKSTQVQEPAKLRWKKIGGGSMRLPGIGIIKPGQTFSATADQIPGVFRDLVKCLSTEEEVVASVKAENAVKNNLNKSEELYELKNVGEKEWDVINTVDGKAINEKPLTKKAATELLKSLEE